MRRPLVHLLVLAAAILAAGPVPAQEAARGPTLPSGDDALAGLEGRVDSGTGLAVVVGGGGAGEAGACQACHGADGAGQPEAGIPRLAGQPAWYQWKQLRDYASDARANEIMSPIAKALSDEDMRAASVHFALQGAVPVPDPATPSDRDAARIGATLSSVGSADQGVQACGNCHGPGGAGVPPAFPALAGQNATYHAAQLQAWKDGSRTNDPLGVMREIAARLTDDQIRALAAYFEGVRPLRPPETAQR